ncbi:MAG TPA: SET domain-containing protein [Chlamydiales bacterium]|nr:SET domain-containing protein [Chlamydiales bacterium]
MVKFRLFQQEMTRRLNELGIKKLKENKIRIPQASKKTLKELAIVSKEIQKDGVPKSLVLKKITPNPHLGYGIFLHPEAKPILKGEAIAPYSGTVFLCPKNAESDSDYTFSLISEFYLTKKEQLDWDSGRRYHPRRLYSIDLDAEKKGNFTRFINHSERPNVEARMLKIPENSLQLAPSPFEIIYFAKKIIHPGQQLLVCYEPDDKGYWGTSTIKPFPMTPGTFQLNSSCIITNCL